MWMKKYGNLALGLFFLGFGLVYFSQIPLIRISRISPINSRLYPGILVWLILALASMLTVIGAMDFRKASLMEEERTGTGKNYLCVILTLLLAAVYVSVLEWAGFLIASTLYIFAQTLVMCPRNEVKPLKFAVISLVSSVIIFIVFRNWLNLMLPEGPLVNLL